jgi:uncharacterized Zn finger protein (UPF0148 family)
MLRIPCPKCKESSFTSDVESFNSCPICGFKFSGKHGPDRRSETRIKKEIPFVLTHKGKDHEATTSDFSEGGIGIEIFGEIPVTKDDVLNLAIGENCITARAMWVKKIPHKSLAGLSKLN